MNPIESFFSDLFGGLSSGVQDLFGGLFGKSPTGTKRKRPAARSGASGRTLAGDLRSSGALRAIMSDASSPGPMKRAKRRPAASPAKPGSK